MSASYFPYSRNLRIGDLHLKVNEVGPSRSDRAYDSLCDNIASDAIHNSDARCNAPKCHPETRKAVQEEILSWIKDGDNDGQPKKILWVTGPAGAGKTAIAGSIAEICEDEGLLAGSFFFSSFSGPEKRKSKRFLVGTLVYSFLQHDALQPLRGFILAAIERDRVIFNKRLRDQCKALLLKPFYDTVGYLDLSSLPKVIIIDGLDEVTSENSHQLDQHEGRSADEADQVEILSALLQATHDANFPFRILIVSRPEPAIREFFSNDANHVSREIFLDYKYDPGSDITLFLKAKFSKIRRHYGLPPSWPSEVDIKTLVDTASGQFIYAATVVRFLQDNKLPDPQGRLQAVLSLELQSTATNPLAPLDALYTRILRSSPDPCLATRWIGAITVLRLYESGEPAWYLRHLLEEYEGQLVYLLENLPSLVKTPQDIDDYGHSSYEFYHKSLTDFLESGRCERELGDAYRSGSSLVWERSVHVLKVGSTYVPLPEPRLRDFLGVFSDFLMCKLGTMPDSFHEDMETCDVVWWAHAMATHDRYLNAPRAIDSVFRDMHKWCRGWESGGFRNCLGMCRHWRSNIIRACKACGWATPNATNLLTRRLEAAYNRGRAGGWQEYFLFFPPGRRDSQARYYVPPIGNLSPTTYGSIDDEYESLCNLADAMFSRLPDDWMSLCEPDPQGNVYKLSEALSAQIRKIEREFGVDIRGVDEEDSDTLRVGSENRGGAGNGESDASLSEAQDEVDDEDQYESSNEDQYESADEGQYESTDEGGCGSYDDDCSGTVNY